MVDELVERGDIWRSATEQAFRTVHRHRYLPDTDLDEVYRCRPVITKVANGVPISSSSDPGVMGIMIEELDIRRGHAILEIGTGTGYNAAILAELACRNGKVITMDIDDDICQFARRNLSMSGYGRVKVVCEDGAYGYAAEAPYDRIIVTAGVYDLSPHWVEQLRPNGLIVLPLRIRGQQCLVTFVRRGQSLHSRSVKGGGLCP